MKNYKYLFQLILIGTTTTRKLFCRYIEPRVYEVNIEKKIGRGIPTPNYVALVDISFSLLQSCKPQIRSYIP